MVSLTMTGVVLAGEGDVTDVCEIDRLESGSLYDRIRELHLAKWTDKHLVCCYRLHLAGKTDMGDIV